MIPFQYLPKLVGEEVSVRDFFIVHNTRQNDKIECAFLTWQGASEFVEQKPSLRIQPTKGLVFVREGKVLGYVLMIDLHKNFIITDPDLYTKASALNKLSEQEALALGFEI